jgi:acyl-CoA synthetase (AMP-forming)/AMP-acid ligase II
VLARQSSLLPGPGLVEFLREKKVSATLLPPSVLAALSAEAGSLQGLRTLIAGGESCSAEVVSAWAPGRRFFNAYGPTEVTVWATMSECTPDGRTPAIGSPGANMRLYVLDAQQQPVPVGVTGELYVASPGLAEGYLNQPALTAERFVPNPFAAADGAVMYRTGDLVRWTAGGELEFLGRRDQQVKIRGYRIELEEIQEVLRRCPAVSDAVVLVRQGGKGPSLAAYVVPRERKSFSTAEVRVYLRERLPHYMLPTSLVAVDSFPLNSSGKVDRARLLQTPTEEEAAPARGAPRTEAERALAAVWAQVLKVSAVGVDDNFFDLGGASIETLDVASQAAARGLAVTPEMLFRYQTVAELAAACGAGKETPHPPRPPLPQGERGEQESQRKAHRSQETQLPPLPLW